MNKKTAAIVCGLLAIIVAALIYVGITRGQSHEPANNVSEQRGSVEAPVTTPKTDKAGVYTPYDATKLASTEGDILLFFHASWCPQCRAIEQSIYDDGLPNGVTVYKVDYDTNQALRQQYGVTLQTTFVKIDQRGEKLASYVAYSEPTFSAVKRELLP